MSTLTDSLVQDHRDCDQAFSQAENLLAIGEQAAAIKAFDHFVAESERHFIREEQVLFPEFEQVTGQSMGPTAVMREEHKHMRQLFQEMTACLRGRDRDAFLGLGETLFILLQQHNGKEEQVLYPMSERLLADRATELVDRFRILAG
jgi:iron-sulfur cluster repair protein YtfE (RIC family)